MFTIHIVPTKELAGLVKVNDAGGKSDGREMYRNGRCGYVQTTDFISSEFLCSFNCRTIMVGIPC